MPEVVHKEFAVESRFRGDKEGPLTAEDAKEILGWEIQPEEEEWESWTLRDLEGNRVILTKNPTNRPFRMSLAKRYALEILRGKWRGDNGETLKVDAYDFVQDGQHRLVGLVLASQMQAKDPEKWITSPVMEALIVYGVNLESADTVDLGQKRSLGDVIFRRTEFGGEYTEKDEAKLSKILAGATRLVWLRVGGKRISDAPHFPHSEALVFLEAHPRIQEAAIKIFSLEGGGGTEGRRISAKVSLAYAAGMFYLMATCRSTAEEVKCSTWQKASGFWNRFASGTNLEEGSPVLTVSNLLPKIEAGGGKGRDRVCGSLAKAWNAYVENKPLTAKECRVKERVSEGKRELAEYPRVGGLDVELPEEGER